jgi:predicted RNA-binding Zn-ribbon protein involved in translation (DUF1610 family)
MIEINKPKWEGNQIRRIGLADYRLRLEGNIVEINITYRNKEGLRLYPDPFYARKVDIVKYPVESASGTKVYVVPISDLSISPTLETKYVEYDFDCPSCKTQMRQNLHKNIVSYKCVKCGKSSIIEWEVDTTVATETPEILYKDGDVPVLSKVDERQNNLF